MSCGVGRRLSSDPLLQWLWWRLASEALTRPLAWEPPYAAGAALKESQKKKGNAGGSLDTEERATQGEARVIQGEEEVGVTNLLVKCQGEQTAP